jgi:hypothetical protein
MKYDLWDLETGNMVNTYRTEVQALEAIRALLASNGADYVNVLSLGCREDGDRFSSIAEGEALAKLARNIKRDGSRPSRMTVPDGAHGKRPSA